MRARAAAILMLALGEAEAAEVMRFLGPREVLKLGAAMATMKAVKHEDVVTVLDAFKAVPAERILLESDAPDMLPPQEFITHPLPDGRNHPAYIMTNHATLFTRIEVRSL